MLKLLTAIVGLFYGPILYGQTLTSNPISAQKLPAEIIVKGKVVQAQQFTDALGDNILVLTQVAEQNSSKQNSDSREAYLYGYRFVKQEGKFTQLWMIQDWVKACEFDISCEFIKGSVAITDLNKNGMAETSFLYKTACRSDVSPATLKLIMHEGATKYAIRGTTLYTGIGGEKTIDASFNKADKSLLDFAIKQWNKFKKED
ncbi:MAG: hypothetical protein U0Y10_13210 [Spirosomataceae bacterium]